MGQWKISQILYLSVSSNTKYNTIFNLKLYAKIIQGNYRKLKLKEPQDFRAGVQPQSSRGIRRWPRRIGGRFIWNLEDLHAGGATLLAREREKGRKGGGEMN